MRRTITLTMALMLGFFSLALAQNTMIKGHVSDNKTNEPLSGVHIKFPKLKKNCISDKTGNFMIEVPNGTHKMQVMSMGYQPKVMNVKANKSTKTLHIALVPSVTGLHEVEITRNKLKRSGASTTRLDVPLKDIPMTVSALDKELIDEMQVTSINDAMRYTTGVKPTVNYGGFQTFKLRGLGRPVIMVDGAVDYRMVFANSAPVTTLTSVNRIEYLKGPASVTHGHSADGGIINIIRNQPTDQFTANFSTYYGSWNNRGATVGAGGKLSNKVNYRFDAGFGDTDGWRDFGQKYSNVYGALDFNFDKKNKLEARFGANNDFYATETGFPVLGTTIFDLNGQEVYHKGYWVKDFNRKQRYNDPQDFLKHKNMNGGLNFIHSFSDVSKLTFRTSYTYDYIDYLSTEELTFPTDTNATYSNYFLDGADTTYIDLAHVKRSYPFSFAHETKTLQNSADFTTTLNTGDIKHHLVAGYTMLLLDRTTFKASTYGAGKNAIISVINPTLQQGYVNRDFNKAAIYSEFINSFYAQNLVEFSSKLKALAALRLDHYNMDYQTAKVETGKKLVDHSDILNQTRTAFTYRFGVVYDPIKELSLYASYSNFFRPNRRAYGSKAIYLDENGNVFNPTFFEPEKGYQAEVGFRYSRSKKVQFNAAAYYINKENIVQYVEQTPEGDPVYAQIGQTESKGFEVDMNYRPIKGLNLTAGYTLCEAKYIDFSIDKYTAENKGNYLQRNPKNQFFLWSFYEVQKGLLKNLNVGFGVNYTDEMFTSASNAYNLPSYWLTEATIGYKLQDNIYFKFKVNNILDEEYVSNSVMSNQFIPGAERNFLFTVGYKL